MKIIHLTYTLDYGGIETMLVNIVNEQAKAAEVALFLINDQVEPSLHAALDSRVRLINAGRPVGSKNPFYLLLMNYLLWREKADVIHVHHPGIVRFFCRSLLKKSCLVFTMHDIPLAEDLAYLRFYPHIFAISRSVQQALELDGYKSTVVYNGIVPENFSQSVAADSEKCFRMVQVSRLFHEKKGQDLLLKACAMLVERWGIRNFSLDFIGEGASKNYLQGLVAELGLGSFVRFLGAKPPSYIASHLKDYDLFVQPSRWEGFGLTAAEAMAAKVPVLVSDQEGPMEVIDNGAYGFHFPSGNVEKCAAAIREIMQRSDRKVLAEKAASYVAKMFDIRQTARNYLQEYRKCLDEKN